MEAYKKTMYNHKKRKSDFFGAIVENILSTTQLLKRVQKRKERKEKQSRSEKERKNDLPIETTYTIRTDCQKKEK